MSINLRLSVDVDVAHALVRAASPLLATLEERKVFALMPKHYSPLNPEVSPRVATRHARVRAPQGWRRGCVFEGSCATRPGLIVAG